MNKLLGKNIGMLRNSRKMTQEQMADQLGMNIKRYVGIENGTNDVNYEVLSQISHILDVSIEDIARGLDLISTEERGARNKNASLNMIFDMLALFYANKHLYEKIAVVDM